MSFGSFATILVPLSQAGNGIALAHEAGETKSAMPLAALPLYGVRKRHNSPSRYFHGLRHFHQSGLRPLFRRHDDDEAACSFRCPDDTSFDDATKVSPSFSCSFFFSEARPLAVPHDGVLPSAYKKQLPPSCVSPYPRHRKVPRVVGPEAKSCRRCFSFAYHPCRRPMRSPVTYRGDGPLLLAIYPRIPARPRLPSSARTPSSTSGPPS